MRCKLSKIRTAAMVVAALLIAGCRGGGSTGSSPMLPVTNLQRAETTFAQPKTKHKIDHIVIVIQENRSLENLFYDYPNAGTVKFGYGHLGQKIAMQQISLKTHWDFQHAAAQFNLACNGKGPHRDQNCQMNRFDEMPLVCHNKPGQPCHPPKDPAYSYVPHNEIVPYLDMAKQYVLAAKMFASNFDMSSFTSHQYIIAGKNPDREVNYPDGLAWGCPGGKTDKIDELLPNRGIKVNAETPCWTPNTLGNELDKAGITWAYYATPIPPGLGGKSCGTGQGPDVMRGVAGIWSAYQAIHYICYGSDWNNDIKPTNNFLSDVASGNLRAVTWVTPRFSDSDHPGNFSSTGPSWVACVVNAIGKSKFWSSTAIFIFWDDPGGWYDPVPPPYLPGATQNDPSDSLGFRLPLLIVSPYAKKGWVSQVQYEHGSILRFIEDRFGLPQLAASDTRATSPAKDCFDFSKPPRTFVPIATKYPESYFLHEPDDFQPPDND